MGGSAPVFIRRDFTAQRRFIWYPTVETLALQDAQCDLGHISPTAVLGCIRPCQLLQNAPRFCGRKGFIKRRGFVGVAGVQHETHPLGLRIPHSDQPAYLLGKVPHSPPRGAGNMPPAALRLTAHKHGAGTVALVFIVIRCGMSRFGGQKHPPLRHELRAGCITVALRPSGIIGLLIEVEDVLPGGDELGTSCGQAPLLFLPGLEGGFLRTWRTVSRAIDAAKPRAMTLSASSRSVQCVCPSGAGVHATAMRCAACLSVSFRWAPGRGASLSASRPVSTNRWRVRATVVVPTSNAVAMASSLQPSAALSKIRARASFRALVWPLRSMCAHVARSSELRATIYFFFGMSGGSFSG